MFKELETIVLKHDIAAYGLKEGTVGAIVDVHGEGEAYEVEFIDTTSGRTIALLTLTAEDLKPLESSVTITWESTLPLWSEIESEYVHIKSKSKAKTEEYNYQSI